MAGDTKTPHPITIMGAEYLQPGTAILDPVGRVATPGAQWQDLAGWLEDEPREMLQSYRQKLKTA